MNLSGRGRVVLRASQAVALVGLAGYAFQATFDVCGPSVQGFFEDYVYTALIAGAGILCLARASIEPRERAAWGILGAGLLSWAAGEVYYSAALADLADPPLPSVSDALWFAFYPAAYVALVLLVRARAREFRTSLWVDGIVGALALAALGTALVVGAIAGGPDSRSVAVDLSYLLGDLLLIGFVIAAFALTGWRPGRAWTLLGAGLVMGAAVDAFFLYEGAIGAQLDSTLAATAWPASALLLGLAAWQAPARKPVTIDGWRVLALPAGFGLIALGVLASQAIKPLPTVAVVLAVATLVALILRLVLTFRENVALLEGSRVQASTDALTGLANRRQLMTDLEHAVEEATRTEPQILVLFDLNGFKDYNDRYGHPVGDALLARLGRNLAAAAEPLGNAYRLGGDEFCVIARGPIETLRELPERACEALSDRGRGFEVGASYGAVLIPAEASEVTLALHIADERLYAQKGGTRRAATQQTSDALLQVLRECEPTIDGHLREVAVLARALGEHMDLGGVELDDLTRAAELHDVGKVAVPSGILRKRGPLEPAEWSFVRQHTLVGDRILSAAPALSRIAKVVRATHEHYDGGGYPDGASADEIPLAARVVAVCDAYHAMTTDRPYREARTSDEALAELRRCAGHQFDPAVVEAFCDLLAGDQRVEDAVASIGAPQVPQLRAAQA